MALTIFGEHPLARDESGVNLRSRIGTIFPYRNTIVTLPGIHATQRLAFTDQLSRDREAAGQPPLTDAEQMTEWENSVDLIMENDEVLIRPDPDNMALAFKADEALQALVPKQKIKFLHVLNKKVRDAIKRRGECWRIAMLPKSVEDMKKMIADSRIAIRGRPIYYYNKSTGTRQLTYQDYCGLSDLPDDELREHLTEIQNFSARGNRMGRPEIDFFMADNRFSSGDFGSYDFALLDAAGLREVHRQICQRLARAIPPEYHHDDPDNAEWRARMTRALIGQGDQAISEESQLGLSAEFFMQIEWLPGTRIEEGELLFDSVLTDCTSPEAPDDACAWHELAKGFIFNFIRDYGDLEYVNIGRVTNSLSRRERAPGRRDVFIAEIKVADGLSEIVRIIRMQKWGVCEHLDEGKDLLQAMLESEEYMQYILDRRLGCRQLGMNLPPRVAARKLPETYRGDQARYHGRVMWSPYFERDYIRGIASDKMPNCRFEHEAFASRFAHLLGRAAAPNIIVGRTDLKGAVIFDDGDEVVIEDSQRLPITMVVADHTGTFSDFRKDLVQFAPEYARPINTRLKHLGNPRAFASLYLSSFLDRFCEIQQEYQRRKRAFDFLFLHEHADEAGNFPFRWQRVLARLDRTDAHELMEAIRSHIDPEARPA